MRHKILKILLSLLLLFSFFSVSYAQRDPEIFNNEVSYENKIDPALKEAIFINSSQKQKGEERRKSLFSLFTSKVFAAPKNKSEDRKQLREEWRELLGIDVFYPYFKAKEIEHAVQQKTSFHIFDIKGRPEFNEDYNQVEYIFKKKF